MVNDTVVVNPMLWYVCKYCGRALQLASSLVEHKKREHREEFRAEKKNKKKKPNRSDKEKKGHSSGHVSNTCEMPPDIRKEDAVRLSSGGNADRDDCSVVAHPASAAAPAINQVSCDRIEKPTGLNVSLVLSETPSSNVVDAVVASTKRIDGNQSDKLIPIDLPPSAVHSRKTSAASKSTSKQLLPSLAEELPNTPEPGPVEKTNTPLKAGKEVLEKDQVKSSQEHLIPNVANSQSNDNSSIRKVSKSFRCTFCERIFKNAGACAMHTKTHTGETPYKCRVCEIGFRRKDDWKTHELTHVNHSCKTCQQIFPSPEACSEHETTHSNVVSKTIEKSVIVPKSGRIKRSRKKRKSLYSLPKHHKCHTCRKLFATPKTLEVHRAREHPVPSQYMCRFCTKTFATSNTCRIHEYIHTGETPYECLYCDLSFSTSGRRITHMKNMHPREYATSSRFHRNSHHDETAVSQDSENPVNTTTSSSNARTSAIPKPPQESLKFIFRLAKGTKSKVKKAYILPSCNTQLHGLPSTDSASTKNIDRHRAVYKCPCSYCGRNFKSNVTRKSHELIHTGLKSFSCDTCGKRFRLHQWLKEHVRIHTGEKPYQCEVCSKTFSHRSTFGRHVKAHKEEKPHQCNQCKASFSTESSLRSHIDEHNLSKASVKGSYQKIFKCQQCSLSFRYKLSLKKHLEKHDAANADLSVGKNYTLKKARTVSIVRPTTRSVDVENTVECDKSLEPTRTENFVSVIRQEVSSGLLHYTCTLCRKVFWYKNEADAHVQIAHHEA